MIVVASIPAGLEVMTHMALPKLLLTIPTALTIPTVLTIPTALTILTVLTILEVTVPTVRGATIQMEATTQHRLTFPSARTSN